jgi:hypothetical protein
VTQPKLKIGREGSKAYFCFNPSRHTSGVTQLSPHPLLSNTTGHNLIGQDKFLLNETKEMFEPGLILGLFFLDC